MTALNPSTDIPASIDSVEKLHAWTSVILSNLYAADTVQEASNKLSRVADVTPYEVTVTDPISWRLIGRVTLGLDSNWQLGQGGMWEHIQPLGDAIIPAAFKQS